MFWVIWIILAVALAIAELSSGDFTLLMIAVGALGGFVAALVFPSVIWLQVLVAAATGGAGLWLVRPALLQRVNALPGYISSVERMLGSEGIVLEQSQEAELDHVKINGEVWTARSVTGVPLAVGSTVIVTDIDGTVALVTPLSDVPRLNGQFPLTFPTYPSADGPAQPEGSYWAAPPSM
ncbi:MAG: NfeD family protein [Propionibacteriaceae bacterium]|jgi:membrane protein implicated in regulation of membrane protease activity|nr:NfeD family protein [Propionibacteriaceae bacterium]